MSEWRRNTTEEKWEAIKADLDEAEMSVQAELAAARGEAPADPNELSPDDARHLAALMGLPELVAGDTLVDDGDG